MNKDEAFLDYESIKIPNALPQKKEEHRFYIGGERVRYEENRWRSGGPPEELKQAIRELVLKLAGKGYSFSLNFFIKHCHLIHPF